MTEGFFPLTIKKLVRETADATTFYFDIPASLKDTFAYSAGQYLTFEVEINGEKVRRSYSLCTYSGVDADPAVTVKEDRSLMNITFRIKNADLDKAFLAGATERDMDGLKGHRSVGGFRASIYNAFPKEGCQALAEYLKERQLRSSR